MKKKSKLPIILVLFFLIISNLGNYWYFNIYQESLYKDRAIEYESALISYKTPVYIATTDISAGTKISEDMLTLTEGFFSNNVGLFRGSDIGKTAITNISFGSVLHSNMVYDETINPGNTAQYENIQFPNSAVEGNYVDIRIRFSNGMTYTVISKTRITGTGADYVLLTLTEEEHQYLSSAMVDSDYYKAEVYATIYTSPETQEHTQVTYIPRKDVLPLIYSGNELNILQRQRDNFEGQIGGIQ